MKKKYLISIIISVILCLIIIFIVLFVNGVFIKTKKQSIKITEVYNQLKNEPLSIDVKMNDSYTGSFTVNDKEQVKEIYEIVYEQDYLLTETELSPGSNKTISFVFDNSNLLSISSRYIRYEGNIYLASKSNELDNLLNKIGLEKNAISEK